MDNPNSVIQGRRIVDHPTLNSLPDVATVTLTIDGMPIEARTDDTVASGMLVAGMRVFRTMPRTGERRGGFCFVGRCTDCLMTIDTQPNRMACQTLVREGMSVERQDGLGAWTTEQSR